MTTFDIDAHEAERIAKEAELGRLALEYQQYFAEAGIESELVKKPYDWGHGVPARFTVKGASFRLVIAAYGRTSYYFTLGNTEYHLPVEARTTEERREFMRSITDELLKAQHLKRIADKVREASS